MSFRVLTLGWEYPPYYLGGLGMASEGIVQGLIDAGATISLILPYPYPHKDTPAHLTIHSVNALQISEKKDKYWYLDKPIKKRTRRLYGENLFDEIERYKRGSKKIIKEDNFDVIHAHEWMTFKAGMQAKKITGKPLILHVHATESDRCGGGKPNKKVFAIEKKAFKTADTIIAVSKYTKNVIINQYDIPPEKIAIVYNALPIEFEKKSPKQKSENDKPTVLFLGRLTKQKGPKYFIDAAHKVLQQHNGIHFIIAGSGDQEKKLKKMVKNLSLTNSIHFTGFLRGDDLINMYQKANLFVMPSVSEPFGLVALEAIHNDLPTILSHQSGVSEMVESCIKVNYWDTDAIAQAMLHLINNPEAGKKLAVNAKQEVAKLTWKNAAKQCIQIYKNAFTCV